MFRFRFQALLAIRRREEMVRQGALARELAGERSATVARTMLADELERARGDLAEAMRLAARGTRDGSGLLALVSHVAQIDGRLVLASQRCERAVRLRQEAAASLEEAARPRRALERLEATERERYDTIRARADEAEFGDANARIGRASTHG